MWFDLWKQISDEVAVVAAAAAFVAVIYAGLLRWATDRVAGIELPFGQAYVLTWLSWFMQAVAQVIIAGIGAVMHSRHHADLLVMVLAPPVSLLVQAMVIKWRVYVGFGKALLISIRVAVALAVLCALCWAGYLVVT